MKKLFESFIDDCVILEPRVYKNLRIIPFIHTGNILTDYISLDTAIDQKEMIIEEISKGGSVPEIQVTNKADRSVLIIDGEELIGAKQNRVMNTSVLIAANTMSRIPVSCVEQGRWEYKSKRFTKSDYMMTNKARMKKRKSVNVNLKNSRNPEFRSDQNQVWSEVTAFSRKAMIDSDTMAMNDVYEGRKIQQEEYLNNIKIDENVNGVIAMINGNIVGMEYISKPDEFRKVLPKLIRSYAIDASLNYKETKENNYSRKLKRFFERLNQSKESRVKSVNIGEDVTIEGIGISGAALVHDDNIIHFMAYDEEVVEKL